MLAVGLASHHCLISHLMGVEQSRGLFLTIVLQDKLLLSVLDALPISLKQDVQDGVLSKDELDRRGACGGVNR